MKRYSQYLTKVVSFLLFIAVWNIVAHLIGNRFLFPDIKEILKALGLIVTGENFLTIIGGTLRKLIMVILVSGILGTLFGVLSYRYRIIKILILPYVSFVKSVPTIAMIILVLIWSRAEIVPVIVGSLILFPILYDHIISGIESIDRNLVKMSKIFKVSRYRMLKDIYIPGVYFHISGGIHSLVGLTFKVIIAGEVLSQESMSIGGEILLNKIYLESSKIFAWVIIVILLNFVIEQSILFFNGKITSWR